MIPVVHLANLAMKEEGLEAAFRQYKELKQQQPDAYAFGAEQLNLVGRKLLQHGKTKEDECRAVTNRGSDL